MDNFDELDRKGFLGLYRQMSGYIRVETELRNDEEERNFITMFGTSPDMCSYLWLLLQTQSFLLSAKARPVHLLWGLVMLKTYGSETLLLHSVRISGPLPLPNNGFPFLLWGHFANNEHVRRPSVDVDVDVRSTVVDIIEGEFCL